MDYKTVDNFFVFGAVGFMFGMSLYFILTGDLVAGIVFLFVTFVTFNESVKTLKKERGER